MSIAAQMNRRWKMNRRCRYRLRRIEGEAARRQNLTAHWPARQAESASIGLCALACALLMCLHSGVAPLGEPSSSWPAPFPISIGPALFKNRISIGAPAALAKLMWKRMDSASSAQRVQLTTLSKDRKMQCKRANTFWTRRNVWTFSSGPFELFFSRHSYSSNYCDKKKPIVLK